MNIARLVALVLAGLLLASGCGDTHPSARDKNTNWLEACANDDGCGGDLQCIGGVCTRACGADIDCSADAPALRCTNGVCGARTVAMGDPPDAARPEDAGPAPDAGKPMAAGSGSEQPARCTLEQNDRLPGERHYDVSAFGPGACSGSTLFAVIAAIHAAYPDLSDIRYVANPDAPPPPGGFVNTITAFASADGFAIAMRRGSGDCPAGCIDNEYWYFRTGADCKPVQVGHYRPQGQSTDCEVEGYPMWDQPVPPPGWPAACGAPATPSSLRDRYTVRGCGQSHACSAKDAPAESVDLELDVQIAKSAGDGLGTVILRGTGHALLDDRPLPARFEGARVTVETSEALPTTCLDQYTVQLTLDLDGNLPSTLFYEEARTPDCTGSPDDYCKANLQLEFGRVRANSYCFEVQDAANAIEWARLPLRDCETDDDCSVVPILTRCYSGCPAGVRTDQVAALEQAIERAGAAYCTESACNSMDSCVPMVPVCREGKCETVASP